MGCPPSPVLGPATAEERRAGAGCPESGVRDEEVVELKVLVVVLFKVATSPVKDRDCGGPVWLKSTKLAVVDRPHSELLRKSSVPSKRDPSNEGSSIVEPRRADCGKLARGVAGPARGVTGPDRGLTGPPARGVAGATDGLRGVVREANLLTTEDLRWFSLARVGMARLFFRPPGAVALLFFRLVFLRVAALLPGTCSPGSSSSESLLSEDTAPPLAAPVDDASPAGAAT